MKVLIFGHKGWIGGQVVDALGERFYGSSDSIILATSRSDDVVKVQQELDAALPTHVMAFIGRTHGQIGFKEYKTIDYLEQPGKLVENVRDNLFSPVVLAILCKERGIHFTYMGTGCIFNWDHTHPSPDGSLDLSLCKNDDLPTGFTENDVPNFFGSGYSTVKGFTDRLMHLFDNNVLNIRIRMPITDTYNSRNFVTKITNYEKVCSIPNSMTVLPTLIPVMIDMALKGRTGTINLVNPGLITHNQILEMYRNIVDATFTWKNFTLEEQSLVLAAGRSNNHLDTTLLEKEYPEVPHIHEAVKQCLYKMRGFQLV